MNNTIEVEGVDVPFLNDLNGRLHHCFQQQHQINLIMQMFDTHIQRMVYNTLPGSVFLAKINSFLNYLVHMGGLGQGEVGVIFEHYRSRVYMNPVVNYSHTGNTVNVVAQPPVYSVPQYTGGVTNLPGTYGLTGYPAMPGNVMYQMPSTGYQVMSPPPAPNTYYVAGQGASYPMMNAPVAMVAPPPNPPPVFTAIPVSGNPQVSGHPGNNPGFVLHQATYVNANPNVPGGQTGNNVGGQMGQMMHYVGGGSVSAQNARLSGGLYNSGAANPNVPAIQNPNNVAVEMGPPTMHHVDGGSGSAQNAGAFGAPLYHSVAVNQNVAPGHNPNNVSGETMQYGGDVSIAAPNP